MESEWIRASTRGSVAKSNFSLMARQFITSLLFAEYIERHSPIIIAHKTAKWVSSPWRRREISGNFSSNCEKGRAAFLHADSAHQYLRAGLARQGRERIRQGT